MGLRIEERIKVSDWSNPRRVVVCDNPTTGSRELWFSSFANQCVGDPCSQCLERAEQGARILHREGRSFRFENRRWLVMEYPADHPTDREGILGFLNEAFGGAWQFS
ncbi:MAG: hypothetical protein V1826_02205 [bacterium]